MKMNYAINKVRKPVCICLVFFLTILMILSGFLSGAKQNSESAYAYAEGSNTQNILSGDIIESIADSPMFEDAIMDTDEYINSDFDVDALIDKSAKVTEVNSGGIHYEISSVDNPDGSRTVVITSDANDNVVKLDVSDNQDTLQLTQYECIDTKSKNVHVRSTEFELDEVSVPLEEPVRLAATTWASKNGLNISPILPLCGNYWYQEGVNGKKDYLKIGCNATYTIRTDNLTSARQSKCKTYMKHINASNSKLLSAMKARFSTDFLTAALVITAVLLSPTGGGSVAATIAAITTTIGGKVTEVTALVESASNAYKAKDDYTIIKNYA